MKFLLFFFCWISTESCAQVLKNEITNRHVRVEATNIYIVVPDNFIWINRSREFINDKTNSSISINRIETPLQVVHEQMSKENALAQGIIVLKESEIRIGPFGGYVFETSRNTHSEKFKSKLLIFGDRLQCYSIQFVYPESNKEVAGIASRVLESVAYREDNSNSKSIYTMDFEKFNFHMTDAKNDVSTYQSTDASLTITISQFFTKGEEDTGLIYYRKMQQLPYSSIELDETGIQEVIINDLPALQGALNGIDEKPNPIHIYLILISKDKTHFLITGKSPNSEGLKTIKGLIQSFNLKP